MDQLPDLFDRLSAILQSEKLTIRVDHDNLETVYITRENDGTFLISDRNRTFDYLENGKDNYLTPNELDPSIDEICVRNDVELIDIDANDPELLPNMTILRRAKTDEQVRQAVSSVAACIDEIFDQASKL